MLISGITLYILGIGRCVPGISAEACSQSMRSPRSTQVLHSAQPDTQQQFGPSFGSTHLPTRTSLIIKTSSTWRGGSLTDSYITVPHNHVQSTVSNIGSGDVPPSKIQSSPGTADTRVGFAESSYPKDPSRQHPSTVSPLLSPYNSLEGSSANTHPRNNRPGATKAGEHPVLGTSSPFQPSGDLSAVLLPELMTSAIPQPLDFGGRLKEQDTGGWSVISPAFNTQPQTPARSGNAVASASSLIPYVSGPKMNADILQSLSKTAISFENMAKPVVFHTDVRSTTTTGSTGAANNLIPANIITGPVVGATTTASATTLRNTISEGSASVNTEDDSSTVISTSAVTPPKSSTSHKDPHIVRILIPVGVVTGGVCMFFVTFACARHYNKHRAVQNS